MARYVANPVEVEAKQITKVSGSREALRCMLEDGSEFIPEEGMIARMMPQPGDYVVAQADGYIYLNPKEVFERKYRAVESSNHA